MIAFQKNPIENPIRCFTCNTQHFDRNLNSEQVLAQDLLCKIIEDANNLLKDFQSNQFNFEFNIHEHFVEMRRKIDYQREELKNKIDEIALNMIDQTKEKEKSLIASFYRDYTQIFKSNIEIECKSLLDEFSNPNMVIQDVRQEIEKQEKTLNRLKKYMSKFELNMYQIEKHFFQPNLGANRKTFGDLNLNPFSQKLVSCSQDKTIKIWDLDTFKCSKTLVGHKNIIWKVEKLKNNQQILSCSSDRTIKLWDIESGLCMKTYHDNFSVNCIRVLSENIFASGSFKVIKIWNIDDGSCLKTIDAHSDEVKDLVLLSNGLLASCSQDKRIKLWNIEDGHCEKTLKGHEFFVYSLLLLNNRNLASGSADKNIKVWDVESGHCVLTLKGHNDFILNLDLSKNGELISCSYDKTIKFWNLDSGTCIKTLHGHLMGVLSAKAYQENLLISSSYDKTIKIWNLDTNECIQTFDEHGDFVRELILI